MREIFFKYCSLLRIYEILATSFLFLIPAFYRGFLPTMIGIIPYAGTSFSTYEMLKKYRADKAREEGLKPTDPSPYQRLIFGGIAGLLGQGTSFLNLGSGGLWSF